jgi:small subunit ribosomal protein S11
MVKIGIAHIYASYNNIHITVTDLTGAETLAKATGGMVVKAARDESSPYAAMKAADQIAAAIKEKGYDTLHVRGPRRRSVRSPAPESRSSGSRTSRRSPMTGRSRKVADGDGGCNPWRPSPWSN